MSDCIYLDYNASTPLDPRVLECMHTVYEQPQVNAGSITHSMGRAQQALVEEARSDIAASIGAEARDMIFCSGATEAINISIRGIAEQYAEKGRHIICSAIEHRAVLSVCEHLRDQDWEVTVLPVNESGYINSDDLRAAIRADTVLCAVMHVNNEIGSIQDIQTIAELCVEKDVRLFVDAAQSWGKLPLDMQKCPIDAMAITAHKNYGPQGIGALYLRRKPKRLRLQPIVFGGGQERGLRSGTLPVAQIAGMAAAARIIQTDILTDQEHLAALRKITLSTLLEQIPDFRINGDEEHAIAGTINIELPGVDAQELLCALPNVALSMGSACTSSVPKPSHVLSAIGKTWQAAASSLRISFGRMSTVADITTAICSIAEKRSSVRQLEEA